MGGFKYEVQVSGCGDKWHQNGVTFATADEAEQAGLMKWMTWSLCDGYRVVETEEIPNYRWTGAGIEHIDPPAHA